MASCNLATSQYITPLFSHSSDNSIYFSHQSYGVRGGFVRDHGVSADGGSHPNGRVPTPAS